MKPSIRVYVKKELDNMILAYYVTGKEQLFSIAEIQEEFNRRLEIKRQWTICHG
jgi:hypothetical protein